MRNTPKTVIITGASSGIGKDVARGFLEAGSNVVLNARNEERLRSAAISLGHENRVALVPGDIGRKTTGENLVRTAMARFNRIDTLINNAEIFGLKLFLHNTEEDLDSFINTNLKGTYFVTQAFVRQLKAQDRQGGSIVNILVRC